MRKGSQKADGFRFGRCLINSGCNGKFSGGTTACEFSILSSQEARNINIT
jgi:hypothetical protein